MNMSYPERLRLALLEDLQSNLSDKGLSFEVTFPGDRVCIVGTSVADVRELSMNISEPVYHYYPDHADPVEHAAWLTELFLEEADVRPRSDTVDLS